MPNIITCRNWNGWLYSLEHPFTPASANKTFRYTGGEGLALGDHPFGVPLSYDTTSGGWGGSDGVQMIVDLNNPGAFTGGASVHLTNIQGYIVEDEPLVIPPSPYNLAAKNFVFRGNSIVANYRTTGFDATLGFAQKSLEFLNLTPSTVAGFHNLGVAARTMATQLAEFDSEAAPVVNNNTIYISFEHVNGLIESSAQSVFDDYKADCLKARALGALVVATTATARVITGDAAANAAYEVRRLELNDLIRLYRPTFRRFAGRFCGRCAAWLHLLQPEHGVFRRRPGAPQRRGARSHGHAHRSRGNYRRLRPMLEIN